MATSYLWRLIIHRFPIRSRDILAKQLLHIVYKVEKNKYHENLISPPLTLHKAPLPKVITIFKKKIEILKQHYSLCCFGKGIYTGSQIKPKFMYEVSSDTV